MREKLVIEVISQLKTLGRRDGVILLGDDTGLRNVWEEYCVQIQSGDSPYLYAYEDTIYNCSQDVLEKAPYPYNKLKEYFGFINSSEEGR